MVNTEIKTRIEDKILEVLLKAQEIYKRPFNLPTIEYRQMGRTAGRATYSRWHIAINPDFCYNGHLDSMIDQTLPHEIAHLISYEVYGPVLGRGHGRCWKSVMIRLGLRPDRCHNYSLEGVKTRTRRTETATCPTCGEQLMITPYRVRQIQSGAKIFCTRTMRCRYAKQTIVVG